MLIRQAKPEDAQAIARFICMAEGEMVEKFTGFADPEQGAAEILKLAESPIPSRYSLSNNLVAEIDSVPAGSIICFPADDQPELDKPMLAYLRNRGIELDRLFQEGAPGTYYASTMGVDPQFRGKGAGKALLAAAEEKAVQRGFDAISLLVSKDKDRARSLYERVGFTIQEEVTIATSEYYRMVKPLK